jgi:hypothetical protein
MKTAPRPGGALRGRSVLCQPLVAMALLSMAGAAAAQTVLPADVKSTCTVSQTEFNHWFVAQGVEKDGPVLPAKSSTFSAAPSSPSEDPSCPFYKWSAQMFLWLVSPLPPALQDGTHVFDSSTFYDVSPPDSNEQRTLKPHLPGALRDFSPTISQRGNRGQEVVFDSTGKIHDVVRPETGQNGQLLVRDAANQPVEIARIATATGGKPLLIDRTDKAIDFKTALNGAPLLRDTSGKAIDLAESTVVVDGRPRLVTTTGGVVEVEQAGNGVLMAQNGSLVYYLIEVNDVYAYFATGIKNIGGIVNPTPTEFPSTQAGLDQIKNFASHALPPNTKDFPDDIAMTFEAKSSWIEVTGAVNAADYVTTKATVPNYVRNNDNNRMIQSGPPREVTLALVGVHVVGSTLGHPEMIWATFEHVNNSPNPQYAYTTASDAPKMQQPDGAGAWLFSSQGAGASNKRRMKLDPVTKSDIVAVGPASPPPTIGPTDVTRLVPWGTDPTNSGFAGNNTAVISINKSVIGMLKAGDVRKNYIMVGATYTSDGKAPANNIAGTAALANSTMETFQAGSNCFDCHSGDMLGTKPDSSGFGGGLSHIWQPIKPLFQ